MGKSTTMYWRVRDLIAKHGSLRAAARAVRVDAAYLKRLGTGERVWPSEAVLKRIGLKRTVSYTERLTHD